MRADRIGISGYEWVSVGQYLAWVEEVCHLTKFNVSGVYSLRIRGQNGIQKELSRKIRLADSIRLNIKSVEVYMEENVTDVEVCRIVSVLVNNMQDALAIVQGHIVTLQGLRAQQGFELEYMPIEEGEIPF